MCYFDRSRMRWAGVEDLYKSRQKEFYRRWGLVVIGLVGECVYAMRGLCRRELFGVSLRIHFRRHSDIAFPYKQKSARPKTN